MTNKNPQMTLVEHIRELRNTIIQGFLFLLVTFIISLNFSQDIFNFLMAPLAKIMSDVGGTQRMIYTNLTEGFFTYIKVSFFAAVIFSFPFIEYQIWKYFSPAMYKKEKKSFSLIFLVSPILFMLGAILVYEYIVPLAWKFLLSYQTTAKETILPIELEARVSEYLNLIMKLILAFGFCFQMPIILFALAKIGFIDDNTLRNNRKYSIVFIFILAAFTTPPDIVSQIGLAIPLIALYELSIYLCKNPK